MTSTSEPISVDVVHRFCEAVAGHADQKFSALAPIVMRTATETVSEVTTLSGLAAMTVDAAVRDGLLKEGERDSITTSFDTAVSNFLVNESARSAASEAIARLTRDVSDTIDQEDISLVDFFATVEDMIRHDPTLTRLFPEHVWDLVALELASKHFDNSKHSGWARDDYASDLVDRCTEAASRDGTEVTELQPVELFRLIVDVSDEAAPILDISNRALAESGYEAFTRIHGPLALKVCTPSPSVARLAL